MSFQSNSSSLGAQNGSAYGSYPPSNYTDRANFRPPTQRQLSDLSTATYNQHDRNTPNYEPTTAHRVYESAKQYTDTQANGALQQQTSFRQDNNSDQSYTITHQDYTFAEPYKNAQSSTQGATNTAAGQHHLPIYTPAIPRYSNELTFEDGYQNTFVTVPGPQYPLNGDYRLQTPTQNYTNQNVEPNQPIQAYSPTTKRWSTTLCPDERLRMGLSRYPSEEDRRRSYGDAADPRRDH